MKFFELVPQDTKAQVTFRNGKRAVVNGPKRFPTFSISNLVPLKREILQQDEKGLLIDENGKEEKVEGPKAIFVHPQGQLVRFAKIELQPYEAVVVTNTRAGTQKVCVGNEEFKKGIADDKVKVEPQFFLNPQEERLHVFKWTGSRGDTEQKTPGALSIQKLRLQATQTYFSFAARTKDGVEFQLSLMMFIDYTNVLDLLKNDDPLGVMFNTVMAELLKVVGKTKFDDFRKDFATLVEGADVFKQDSEISKTYTALGLKIEKVVLKGWIPQDPSVSRLMAQEATITASQAVMEAEHQKNLKAIGNEKVELTAQAANDAIRKDRATADGQNEAARIVALKTGLGDIDAETVNTILKLQQAGKAATGGLTLTSEAMGMK